MEGNVCRHCKKDLRKVKEIHAVEGMHFCSMGCAIFEHMDIIVASARDTATKWYNEGAEIITPEDIGLI